MSKSINIRPEVSILSIFPHLNYKAWYALAEFVDNALQSYLSSRAQLHAHEGEGYKLKVEIELSGHDGGTIIVRDNAAGIAEQDYVRAFKTASVPLDRTGLSEFGVGMKSAACWFAESWSVRSTALHECVERSIDFDVPSIVRHSLEEVSTREVVVSPNSHYTEVVLQKLHSIPQGRTIGKIKDHLASIYRIFLQRNILELLFNGESLKYVPPSVLSAKYFKNDNDDPRVWLKDISIDFGGGLKVWGFAALLETANTSGAGLAIFRRNRLIEGSGDDAYRPEYIFKKSNSFTFQRLFGELHVEGFEVSHTKDGIQWGEHEDIFLEFLKEQLNASPLPLLEQAEGYRVRAKREDLSQGASRALASTVEAIERDAPDVIMQQVSAPATTISLPIDLPNAEAITERTLDLMVHDQHWRVKIELTTDPSVGAWLDIADEPTKLVDGNGLQVRHLAIRVALAHPFMDRFAGPRSEQIEPLLRVAAATALAEIIARDAGVRMAGTIRRHINELLRDGLAKA